MTPGGPSEVCVVSLCLKVWPRTEQRREATRLLLERHGARSVAGPSRLAGNGGRKRAASNGALQLQERFLIFPGPLQDSAPPDRQVGGKKGKGRVRCVCAACRQQKKRRVFTV